MTAGQIDAGDVDDLDRDVSVKLLNILSCFLCFTLVELRLCWLAVPFLCHAHSTTCVFGVFASGAACQVKKKINGCFSGGQMTKELQELHGANIQVLEAEFWSGINYGNRFYLCRPR